MSISPANNASISDGPALKTCDLSVAGAIADANSPDDTPSTACACVRLAKYPIRTSVALSPDDASFDPQPASAAMSTKMRTPTRIRGRLRGLRDNVNISYRIDIELALDLKALLSQDLQAPTARSFPASHARRWTSP